VHHKEWEDEVITKERRMGSTTRCLRPAARAALGALTASVLFSIPVDRPAGAGELRVLLEGETGVRNDGNLSQVGEQSGQLDPQAQNVGRAGLDLQLSYTTRQRFDLALGYSPSYERSLDKASLGGATHRLDLGLRAALTQRVNLDVRERLLSTPGIDLYAPVIAPESFAAAQRGRQLFHLLEVTLKDPLTHRTTLEVGASQSIRRYENSALSDARTVGGNLGLAFHYDRERALELTAGAQRFNWENGSESNVETLLAGYTHPFGRSTRLRVDAGAFHVQQVQSGIASLPGGPRTPAPAGTGDKTGWLGGAQLSQERRLFRWNVGYRHDVAPGYGVDLPVQVDNGFLGMSANVGRQLTVGLDGYGSRQRDLQSKVLSTNAASANGSGTLTDFATGTLRLSWSFLPSMRLTGGYSHIWQRSNVKLFDNLSYDRYFLGLAFRIYRTGERPRAPEELEHRGEPTNADLQPDAR
jgi:hypothetical protein